MNTSGNEVIRHFVNSMKEPHMLTKSELEMLVSGDTVTKRVDEMITYKELYASMDNLWSTLFMTGYLTQRGYLGNGYYRLAVPNREICSIIIDRVLVLFREEVVQNGELLDSFCKAILEADARKVEQLLTKYILSILAYLSSNNLGTVLKAQIHSPYQTEYIPTECRH